MDLVFFGSNEKHDFVLVTAIALSVLEEKRVGVISDNLRNYKYFDGEVSGVQVGKPGQKLDTDITLYDCHTTILSNSENRKLFLASDYVRDSVEKARRMFNETKFDGLILAEQESSLSKKYFDTYIGGLPIFSYDDSTSRRIDCVFDGRFKFKNMEVDFLNAVGSFLEKNCEVSSGDVKSLWKHLKGRS